VAGENFPELLKALVVEMADATKPLESRSMAGLFLKNQLNAPSAEKQLFYLERWLNLDITIRTNAKDTLLQALMNSANDMVAAKFISIAISEIAAIDLPRGEWNTYITTMCAALEPAIPDGIQVACLEGLGNTIDRMEELRSMGAEEIIPEPPSEIVNQMLTAIVSGVNRPNVEQKRAGLNALNKSLGMAYNNFQIKAERDLILQAFCNAATCPEDPEVRRLAFCCFDNAAYMYYTELFDYMKIIFDLTTNSIQKDTEETVKVQAVEFWVTIAGVEAGMMQNEREIANCRSFVESAKEALVPLLLLALTTHKDESDEDDYDLRHASAVCLEGFAETIHGSILPTVVPFVEANISSTDWRMKDASIVAFMAVLAGQTTHQVGGYVRDIVPFLAQATNDANEIVRDSSLHCFANILKLHIEALLPAQFDPIINSLIARLQDTAKVTSSACTALFALFSFFKKQAISNPAFVASNGISNRFASITDLLLKALDREDGQENNLPLAIAGTLAELVDAAAHDVLPFLRELLPTIINRIEQIYHLAANTNEEKDQKDTLLATFCGVIISLFQKLGKNDVMPHVQRVVFLMHQLLIIDGLNCHVDCWMLVAAVAETIESDFSVFLPQFMPLVLVVLARHRNNSDLCNQVVTTVADIAEACDSAILQYCDDIVNLLLECMRDDSLERKCKPAVISCFGDIAFAIGPAFEPYLNYSSLTLMSASQATANMADEDSLAFFNELRCGILEAYTGIIYAFSDAPLTEQLVSMVQNILQFLEFIALPQSCRDDKVLQKTVALLGDIARNYPNAGDVRKQIGIGWASQLLHDAKLSPDLETQTGAQWTESILQQLFAAS
jgi:importin subunit beta-1